MNVEQPTSTPANDGNLYLNRQILRTQGYAIVAAADGFLGYVAALYADHRAKAGFQTHGDQKMYGYEVRDYYTKVFGPAVESFLDCIDAELQQPDPEKKKRVFLYASMDDERPGNVATLKSAIGEFASIISKL